jgi:hypothetical protein
MMSTHYVLGLLVVTMFLKKNPYMFPTLYHEIEFVQHLQWKVQSNGKKKNILEHLNDMTQQY